MAELLSRTEALELILRRATPLEPERLPLVQAHGRFLACDAVALVDLPPFASSAMDGFAVRSADTPGTLPVVFRIAAGRPSPHALNAGEAMEISTGGVVPSGADAVIPVEQVEVEGECVTIARTVEPAANVRPAAGDVPAGAVLVPKGTRLTAAALGALAASGVAEVECPRRPRATVLVTGTELQSPGEELQEGQVYEANGTILATALASAGAVVERHAPVCDDEQAHRSALERALAADVVVTSGGVSVGPHDLVRGVARELGVEELFWRVAVRPGKPVAFGLRGRTLVFGLPGNPVSALVGFELFVRPALLALSGALRPGPPFEWGSLGSARRRSPARDELVRARALPEPGGPVLEPLSGQESHMIARAAAANALVLVPRGEGELAAGAAVQYLRLS